MTHGGCLIRVISGSRYKFGSGANTVAIASDGTHVWVANAAGQSVIEFPAT